MVINIKTINSEENKLFRSMYRPKKFLPMSGAKLKVKIKAVKSSYLVALFIYSLST